MSLESCHWTCRASSCVRWKKRKYARWALPNTLEPMFGSFLRPIAISWRPSRISLSEDLYYRLARYTIHVPPLRERKEDIPLLARHFMEQFAKEMGKMAPRLSNSAIQKLMAHDFPGNIRELKNVIERTSIECAGSRIRPEMYSLLARTLPPSPTFKQSVSIIKVRKWPGMHWENKRRLLPSMWNHASASPIANVENFWGLRSIEPITSSTRCPNLGSR